MAQLAIVVGSGLVWPVLEIAVFWLRFGHAPQGGPQAALVFVPMGLVAGVIAASLFTLATSDRQRRSVLWGYLVACPFAFVGSLLGGLGLASVWGPLLAGGVPLAAGAVVGFFVGRRKSGPGPTSASN